ncbi:DUF1033 family protein [Falsibacillus albus]|uniref:DUF1033 family protein n=1 Tax=Falsibacillus albus TaxID=2478915 RepID=UPI001314632C|nr:DUF1033 family protein [Falsibacillus albus]
MSLGWRVIIMKGENEPWWFFEDWEEDIVLEKSFDDKEKAISFFNEKAEKFKSVYQRMRQKKTIMAAFWNEGERNFCEGCDDDLQIYLGLMLMYGNEPYDVKEEEEKLFHL